MKAGWLTKADEYRAKADSCEAMANHVDDPDARQHWLHVAQIWRELAELAERHPTLNAL